MRTVVLYEIREKEGRFQVWSRVFNRGMFGRWMWFENWVADKATREEAEDVISKLR